MRLRADRATAALKNVTYSKGFRLNLSTDNSIINFKANPVIPR